LKSRADWAIKISMRLVCRHEKGGTWYVEFERGKKRSLRTKDRAEAERRFKLLQREIAMGKLVVMERGTTKTLKEFRDEFVEWAENGGQTHATSRMNRMVMDMLIDAAGGSTRLDRVSRKHLDTLVATWRKRGLSDRSIDTYTRHLKAALGKAADWEIIKENPLGQVKIPRRKPKVRPHIPPEEIERFLASIEDLIWRRIVALYCATGRRRQELLYLESDMVDMDRRRYCVDRSKTDESEGWYPMTPAALAAFEAMSPFPEGYLLPRMHPDTMSHRIKEHLVSAGYPRVSLHGLRVSFAARYLSAGGSLTVLQRMLGHADFGTTQDHYATLVPGYLDDEASRVDFAVDLKGLLRAIK